jgi:macrodomain Ter protein organizer (MatP/YcbG family)
MSLENRTKAIDELIFRIYKDIMATYDGLDDKSKMAYPKIIVDVVAILAGGVDTSGKKTPVHNVEIYYQTRKSDVISSTPVIPSETSATSATAKSIQSIEREPTIVENEPIDKHIEPELVSILSTITDRSKNNIQASLDKLDRRDFSRITDLYKNYNRIQKYGKMVTNAGDLKQFKVALERDTGRKLSSYQMQHATSSIRKVRLYIENVLDGKFVPRGPYGINHTKHNLEYGYLVIGLMQSSRKKINANKERT